MTRFVTCHAVVNLMRKLVFHTQTKPASRRQMVTGFPLQHQRPCSGRFDGKNVLSCTNKDCYKNTNAHRNPIETLLAFKIAVCKLCKVMCQENSVQNDRPWMTDHINKSPHRVSLPKTVSKRHCCTQEVCRANTQVANCTLTSIRVLVSQKSLIIRGQRIPGDHRHVFLWAVKTLHGANLNNQYRKKKNYPLSQSK